MSVYARPLKLFYPPGFPGAGPGLSAPALGALALRAHRRDVDPVRIGIGEPTALGLRFLAHQWIVSVSSGRLSQRTETSSGCCPIQTTNA